MSDLEALRPRWRQRRLWFYRPSLYWFGWTTLLPVNLGHDEYSRECVVFGWTVTGRIVVPYRWCGDVDCTAQSARWLDDEDER